MEYMAVCHADKIHEREEAIYGTKDSGFTERCKRSEERRVGKECRL